MSTAGATHKVRCRCGAFLAWWLPGKCRRCGLAYTSLTYTLKIPTKKEKP